MPRNRLKVNTKPATENLTVDAQNMGVDAEDLCELVLDAKCAEATTINNNGMSEQVPYLVACYGADEARRMIGAIRQAGAEKQD